MMRTAITLLMLTATAYGQSNHPQHHAYYQGWVNKKGIGCCNNHDCGELADADERVTGGILEIRIEGVWCPVLTQHYLMRGNVPNAASSHACVQKAYVPGTQVCQRLLCYQPRPGT